MPGTQWNLRSSQACWQTVKIQMARISFVYPAWPQQVMQPGESHDDDVGVHMYSFVKGLAAVTNALLA